jgi:very-short-patch-repair endonuclease
MAAVLAAGPGAALSHLAAARLWEIWRRRAGMIDVVAPGQRRARSGFRVHKCRALDPRDVTVRDQIPVTTVARTLVDLTEVLSADQLANVIHEAAFRNRFDDRAVRAAMERARGRRCLAVLEAALDSHARGSAGTRSDLEDSFLAIVRDAGLPEPLVNTRVARHEVDFHWPAHGLCVEIDGAGHARQRTRREDRVRDAALRAVGQRVVRVTGDELGDRAAVLARLGPVGRR